MRRIGVTLVILAVGMVMSAGSVSAGPVANCPTAASGYAVVDRQAWWDRTVAGFEVEGIPVYIAGDPSNGFTDEFEAFSEAAGFGSAQGLYDFVWITQWQHIDKNGDLLVCMKDRPHTPGNPAYFFNGVDNTAN
jgi:hypothetical protein